MSHKLGIYTKWAKCVCVSVSFDETKIIRHINVTKAVRCFHLSRILPQLLIPPKLCHTRMYTQFTHGAAAFAALLERNSHTTSHYTYVQFTPEKWSCNLSSRELCGVRCVASLVLCCRTINQDKWCHISRKFNQRCDKLSDVTIEYLSLAQCECMRRVLIFFISLFALKCVRACACQSWPGNALLIL